MRLLLRCPKAIDGEMLYRFLMAVGQLTGCHQAGERSFIYKNKPFPVCARCTGVFVGYAVAIISFHVNINFSLSALIFGCFVTFIDWYLQKTELLPSTNRRRLITGIIGGFSLMSLYIKAAIALFVFSKALIIG